MVQLKVVAAVVLAVVLAGCAAVPGSHEVSATPSSPVSGPDPDLYAVRMKQCLEGYGFSPVVTEDGGLRVDYADEHTPPDVAAEREAKYEEADAACLKATGYDYVPSVSPEEDYASQLSWATCLQQHGVRVIIPSLRDYLHGTEFQADLPRSDGERMKTLNAACHS